MGTVNGSPPNMHIIQMSLAQAVARSIIFFIPVYSAGILKLSTQDRKRAIARAFRPATKTEVENGCSNRR
jgi:hypothetical protein